MRKFFELFSLAHQQVHQDFKNYFLFAIYFWFLSFLSQFPYDYFAIDLQTGAKGILFSLATVLLSILASIKIYLKEGKKIGLIHDYHGEQIFYFFTCLFHVIIYTFIIFLGLFLLIIPGLFFLIYFYLAPLASIFESTTDSEGKKINYFKKSYALTKGNGSLIVGVYLGFIIIGVSSYLANLITPIEWRIGGVFVSSLIDTYFTLVLNVLIVKIYHFLKFKSA